MAFLLLSSIGHAASPIDLTQGDPIPGELETTFNLGATGMRGWFFYDHFNIHHVTADSRQIQVRAVDPGSPADGLFLPNDVILGASGTSAAPVLFVTDARRSIADAITDAEAANPAHLKLIRWRAGEQSTVTLTLRTMGAYSATAPYDCPKSEKILREGMDYAYHNENTGAFRFGLISFLAAQDDLFPDRALYRTKAVTEARALIKTDADLQALRDYTASTTHPAAWLRSYQLITLAEYYLHTRDDEVFPTIEALAINVAKGLSHYGTVGHDLLPAPYDPSKNYRPAGRGYGAINSAGMPALLGLQMAKRCGISHSVVDEKIALGKMFYAAHTNRGIITYGEGDSGTETHESNGKSGLAAMIFEGDPEFPETGKFFTRLAVTSGDRSRDFGHTGVFFSYFWTPLGVSRGGPAAVQSFFRQVRWQLDLHRRWDGGFAYDSYSENRALNGTEYRNFRMSTAMLLTYALPLKNLFITGRDSSGSSTLTDLEIRECRDAMEYSPTDRNSVQLLGDLGSWSPVVRDAAAKEFAVRESSTVPIATIREFALQGNRESRYGAITALGRLKDTESTSYLVDFLNDDDRLVRSHSAKALKKIGVTALSPYRYQLLTTFVDRFQPALPPVFEDPLQLDQLALAQLIFGHLALVNNRNQLDMLLSDFGDKLVYQVIKATAKHPSGAAGDRLSQLYKVLTKDEVQILASELLDVVAKDPPANRRGNIQTRLEAMNALKKHNVAEAVPAIVNAIEAGDTWDLIDDNMLEALLAYGYSGSLVTPDIDITSSIQYYLTRYDNILTDAEREVAQAILDAISAEAPPESLFYLKNIESVTADSKVVSLAENSTVLRVVANDLAQGDSVFTWKKLSGPGSVEFVPNGTSEANNSTVNFNSIAGNYEFEVTMSDSRGFTEVKKTVSVTLTDDLFVDAGENIHMFLVHSEAKLLLEGTVTNFEGQNMSVDWDLESGPETVVFSDASALETSVTFKKAGEYVLSLTANGEEIITRDSLIVTVISMDDYPNAIVEGLHFKTVSGDFNGTAKGVGTWLGAITDIESEISSIPPYTSEIFEGQIYDADGSISFTEYIDDRAKIWIDGNLVLSDNVWNARTSTGDLNLSPGWHDIKIQVWNGWAGSGAVEKPGIGYDPDGGTNWQELNDPGNGSLLRTLCPMDYASWSQGVLRGGDANGDGVSNVIAWLSGSPNPMADALDLLPVLDVTKDSDYVTYAYRRNYEAEQNMNTSLVVQYSSDLQHWTDLVRDGDDVIINTNDDVHELGVDRVEVKIKRKLDVTEKYFLRLKVKVRE